MKALRPLVISLALLAVVFSANTALALDPDPAPTESPTAETTPVPSETPNPDLSPIPEETITPTPAPTLTPAPTPEIDPLLETWFARRTSEQLAEWAATQEAHDRAWLAQEIAASGSEPGEGTWLWNPCWPPEAMPWYPSDFPQPAQWNSVANGCR